MLKCPSCSASCRFSGRNFLSVLALGLVLSALALISNEATAGTTVSLYKSFAGNINFVTTGGTFRTADNNTDPCAVTTTSSGPISGIPGGSTIVAAYLYYAASDNTVDANVTFNGSNVTADRTFTDTNLVPWYGGFKDVTSLVSGNGTYTLSGLTINTGATWCGNQTVLGGWALVVIYSNNSTESNRVINVYDGFQIFQNSSITLTPSNFQVPNSGINGKFAVFTWEGDSTLSGNETLAYKGSVLTDNCNGTNNQYNSTINTLTCTGNAATDDVYYGVDIDTFDISSYLTAGDTSGNTFYQSGQDAVILTAQIVSVSNTPVADLQITKSHSGNFTAGSNGVYSLAVSNNGPASATGTTTVTDTLPAGESYVSAAGTGWSCSFLTPTLTCTRSDTLASGASFPVISLTVAVGVTTASPIVNTANVSNATFDNVSGNNSSTDSATVVYPSDDLGISKTHAGNFSAGAPASYTLTVTNNGPIPIPAGTTTTVTDSLPASETYVSASGSGWSCGYANPNVTCTTTASAASGGTLPAITLNVTMSASATSPVANTAAVANAYISDGNAANNSSIDNATVTTPNFSTSTKVWTDLNGGDANPGDVIQYTITVNETAGQAGNNIEVTDEVPGNVTNFTVIGRPAGSVNASTGSGTGTNGTGYLDITGISVPANGSVSIVFDVTISGSAAPGDTIDNTATIIGGTAAANPAAPTLTVSQSAVAASGNKILYLYNTQTMNRTPQPASGTAVSMNGGTTADWTLSPVLQKNLVLSAGTLSAVLTVQRTGGNTTRSVQVELRTGSGTSLGTSGTVNFNNGGAILSETFNITLGTAVTVSAGDTLVVRIHNNSTRTNRTINVYQNSAGVGASTLTFSTSTVINVDSVNAYNAAYNAVTTNTPFEPNQTVYVRAVISDPFGSYDIDPATGGTAPALSIKNPNGVLRVTAAAMSQVADSGAATKTFEYAYTIPGTASVGYWTASVTGYEGTEGTVTHTANNSFDVEVPEPLVMNTVTSLSDPVEGATRPKALPGSQMRYTITVYNTGKGPIDSGTLVLTDPVPTNGTFWLSASPPFTFTDGGVASGLSVTAGSDANIAYSNNGGGSYAYTPSCTRPCSDPAITNIKITLNGQMNPSTQAYGVSTGAPYFVITFTVLIN